MAIGTVVRRDSLEVVALVRVVVSVMLLSSLQSIDKKVDKTFYLQIDKKFIYRRLQ